MKKNVGEVVQEIRLECVASFPLDMSMDACREELRRAGARILSEDPITRTFKVTDVSETLFVWQCDWGCGFQHADERTVLDHERICSHRPTGE